MMHGYVLLMLLVAIVALVAYGGVVVWSIPHL
jgi:hypothetical protein